MATPHALIDTVEAPATRAPPRRSGARPYRYSVPLVVAVTGHRDLRPAEIPGIRVRVREFLVELRDHYPDRAVSVMSTLAEGADRLVADEALALGLALTVPLPMPRHLYLQDFDSAESRAEFDRLCAAAVDVFELPIA